MIPTFSRAQGMLRIDVPIIVFQMENLQAEVKSQSITKINQSINQSINLSISQSIKSKNLYCQSERNEEK